MATYNFDPSHSAADFSARHMMISTVRGGFRNVTGKIDFDAANPANSKVEAVIHTAEMTSTGMQQRDDHLKSPDFLDVAQYPTITFVSTSVAPYDGNQKAKITGNLTIKDVTREVVLDAELLGETKSPFGDTRIGFAGTTKIDREQWGLNWNMALEAGGSKDPPEQAK